MGKSATSAAIADIDPRVINLLSPAVGPATQRVEQSKLRDAVQYDWQTGKVHHVALQPQKVEFIEAAPPVPVYVHEFARRVATVKNVKGVIAETGEDQMSVHITTFASGLTEEIRSQIYKIESTLSLANPHVAFDFHLRRQEEVSGSPTPVTGKYYYAIWGFANGADEGSASKASV
jgi:hypothetical protein